MDEPTRLFVYGTLKRRHSNHNHLRGTIFLGEAVTRTNLSMFDGGFPFVSDDKRYEEYSGSIVGELYETDNKSLLSNLDRLEGYPHLYVKREIDVTTLDGSTYQATIYVASEGSNGRLNAKAPMQPKGRAKLLEWR